MYFTKSLLFYVKNMNKSIEAFIFNVLHFSVFLDLHVLKG